MATRLKSWRSPPALDDGSEDTEQQVPFNLDHLSERYSLFILIVLGDTFIKTIGRRGRLRSGKLPCQRSSDAHDCKFVTYFDDVTKAALRRSAEGVTAWVGALPS